MIITGSFTALSFMLYLIPGLAVAELSWLDSATLLPLRENVLLQAVVVTAGTPVVVYLLTAGHAWVADSWVLGQLCAHARRQRWLRADAAVGYLLAEGAGAVGSGLLGRADPSMDSGAALLLVSLAAQAVVAVAFYRLVDATPVTLRRA